MNMTRYLCLVPLAALLTATACKTAPELTRGEGFLSTYNLLQQQDDATWRYINPLLLASCDKFLVSPVKVTVREFQGQPVTAEQRSQASQYVQEAISKALTDRYPLVAQPGPGVGEIRVAITDLYKKGGRLGISVEGEILDDSNTQVAAVMRSGLSDKILTGDWQNAPAARLMIDNWAKKLRAAIDETHK